MQSINNSLNKLLPVGKKFTKYLPFFIGFKLLTFTGFITYIMNRQMITPKNKLLNKEPVNKEERIKKFKSLSSSERQKLILKKMKAIGIEVGSGIPNKKYDSKEVYELIHIANCFPELREKK